MTRPDIDLNLLPIVVALYEERSVSRAAERLGMTQPGLSTALARLRLALGDPLFIRVGGAMHPTDKTLSILEPIRSMVGLVRDQILEPAAFDPARASGPVTVALSDVGEIVFLPQLLETVRRQAPGVWLRSVSQPHDRVGEALASGAVDLAVGYFPDLGGANIFRQQLLSHHFVCLLRAGHPMAVGPALAREAFLQLEHAVVRAPGRSQEVFEQFLKDRRIERKVALTTPHFLSLPAIIARSDLVVTVPHAVGMAFARPEFGLVALDPPFDVPRIELRQHWHRTYHHAPRTVWLRGLVAALFNEDRDEWKTGAAPGGDRNG